MKPIAIFLILTAIIVVGVLVLVPVVRSVTGSAELHKKDIAKRNAVLKRKHVGTPPAVLDTSDPYWQRALEEVDRSPEEIQAQAKREERQGVYLPKLIRGNPHKKLLALTFDDGPHPIKTEELLEILQSENVKATFFVVGKMVERRPDLLRLIASKGHEIGNHTFSHVTLTKVPLNEVRAEYEACNDIVEEVTGKRMRFCRPPGGDYDRDVIKAATEQGLTTVLWTDDPGDYANPGTHVIEEKTLERLSNGGVILLHDGIEQTLQVLPQIIEYAKHKGYRFVTVGDLETAVSASLHDHRRVTFRSPSGRLAQW
ncbi:MAG: peptidoglycan-N-acetylglucosamine deacetylase [Fimbriimonadaceae bacterium]|nr:peptidoglycan-N-acetylglucosamine deacetylase [Fimbriimonadaceae bacterium]